MLADTMWEMFRTTGKIEAYLGYKECLSREETAEKELQEMPCTEQTKRQE